MPKSIVTRMSQSYCSSIGVSTRFVADIFQIVKNAKGLAIFTTMRTGLWVSGAGGSGILIGRKEDGTWSPPSGIMLHTAGLGFLVGVDM
jgi:lipid-binding SYLF domain-containing protein